MEELKNLFKFVLMISIYASLLGGTLLLLKRFLGNRLSPKWHYALWFLLILKLMIPFGPESAVSIANLLKVDQKILAVESSFESKKQPLSLRNVRLLEYGSASNSLGASKLAVNAIALEKKSAGADITAIAAKIWLVGSLGLTIWFIGAGLVFRHHLKKRQKPIRGEVLQLLEETKKQLGLRGSITVQCSEGVLSTGTYGVFRQKILLSEKDSQLEDPTLSFILLHELAHIKRRDSLVNAVLIGLRILHWFNPFLWFCFCKMRQDMEQATDQLALAAVESSRHKDYGKALLQALSNLSGKTTAAGYLGLVDNQKSIEKRIRMIKMNEFFIKKRKTMLMIGMVCMFSLSGLFLTNGVGKVSILQGEAEAFSGNPVKNPVTSYRSETLYSYRNLKTGNKTKLVALLNALPSGSTGKATWVTGKKINGIRYEYDQVLNLLDSDSEHTSWRRTLRKNAAILFCLVKELDYVEVSGFAGKTLKFTRADVQKDYLLEFAKIGQSKKTFSEFLNYLSLEVQVWPEKYALTMSSTPGIALTPNYFGGADEVVFSTNYGHFAEWGTDGKITELGTKVERTLGGPTFWMPIDRPEISYRPSRYEVTVEVYKSGKKLTEKILRFDDGDTGMYQLIEIKNGPFQDLY